MIFSIHTVALIWHRYFYTYLYRLLYENLCGIPYISLPWMLTCCEGLLAPQNLIHNRLLLSWRSLFTWDDTVGISQNVNSSVWLLSVTRLSHFIRSPDLESEWSCNIQRNLAWQWLTIVFNWMGTLWILSIFSYKPPVLVDTASLGLWVEINPLASLLWP